jgi:uncharacterized protein (TIGR03067 family)
LILFLATAIAAASVAGEKTATKAGAAKTGAAEKVPELNLDGIWRGYVVYGKGENPNRGSVHMELTIKGKHIVAKRLDGQGAPLGDGTYRISSGRYYVIDATENRARGKGRTYQGICTFAPDTMKWCTANPGNPRPTAFETKGQQFYMVLKRQRAAGGVKK